MERRIPRTMSSQHPDNACLPPWSRGEVISGEEEVYEAYYAYSALGCEEVMWDAEGKDIDPDVVRKLLLAHPEFFREKRLGRDIFLTYRIPNPSVETAERKVLLETLEAIPRHYDVAERFYGDGKHPPVFEVILPFTRSHLELSRILELYRKIVVDTEHTRIGSDGVTLRDWLGEIKPKAIEVIPLIEDWGSMTSVEEIIGGFIESYRPRYLRVFLARSDPALNYGLVAATLLVKIALSKLGEVERRYGVPVYPILGAGSLPFRGHLSPRNIGGFLEEYGSIYTVTIQSAFKYDYPVEEVKKAVRNLNNHLPSMEKPRLTSPLETVSKCASTFRNRYQEIIVEAGEILSRLSELVPERRTRRLHIGLFGYSRKVHGVRLPRAIPFTSIMYSLGIPPEFLGMRALEELDSAAEEALREAYRRLREDLEEAARYFSWRNVNMMLEGSDEIRRLLGEGFLESALPKILRDIEVTESMLGIRVGPKTLSDRRHENAVNDFLLFLLEGEVEEARKRLVEAARIRRSLG